MSGVATQNNHCPDHAGFKNNHFIVFTKLKCFLGNESMYDIGFIRGIHVVDVKRRSYHFGLQ